VKKKSVQSGPSALDLLEEATHLVRHAPPRALLAYYLGAIPFALIGLYFWADMSCGAFAQRQCPAFALGMALLFLWLKFWQTVFTSALRARLTLTPEPPWNAPRIWRVIVIQGIVQPSRLFLLPITFIATIPFPWALAFYENVTVLGDGTEPGVCAVLRRASAQTRLWPKQNHFLLAYLSLAGAVVWLNAAIAVFTVPNLLKTLLGIETTFTRSGMWSIFNSTFFAVTIALAWLVLDPLLKAVYTLRCFHGEARKDGADLLAELSWVRAAGQRLATAALVAFMFLAGHAKAETGSTPPVASAPSPDSVKPAALESAIQETLRQDKYAWRMPREKIVDNDNSTKAWLRGFFASIGNTFANWARAVVNFLSDAWDWLVKHFLPKHKPVDKGSPAKHDWTGALRVFAYALLFCAAAALVVLLVRLWRQGARRPIVVQAEVVPADPDLNDETITAELLPEDEWLKLARELLQKGESRLALRALYLATLAHLAGREMVSIARFKSNHDYKSEVNRRARGSPELVRAFAANVSSIDRAWYGLYDVSADIVAQFQSNFDRIRSC
jgi:hypothetical protein